MVLIAEPCLQLLFVVLIWVSILLWWTLAVLFLPVYIFFLLFSPIFVTSKALSSSHGLSFACCVGVEEEHFFSAVALSVQCAVFVYQPVSRALCVFTLRAEPGALGVIPQLSYSFSPHSSS